jgi:hypothetical protein
MRVSGKVSDYRSFRGGRPWVTDELKEVDLKKKLETEAGWRQKKKSSPVGFGQRRCPTWQPLRRVARFAYRATDRGVGMPFVRKVSSN